MLTSDPSYVVRAKERGIWQKEREHLLSEQKELEVEIAAFVGKHEGEINELLGEYWTMRKQAGEFRFPLISCLVQRRTGCSGDTAERGCGSG